MNGFYLYVSIACALAVLITIFLSRFSKQRSIVRYIPSILAALAVISFYIKSAYYSSGFEDLGYMVLALIACIVFFISFITAFVIGIVQKNRKSE